MFRAILILSTKDIWSILTTRKRLADELFVIVNSDEQRALKGSKEFQKEAERLFIVQNIKAVDKAMISIDQDRTVCA